jgi:hypothetical protein
MTPRINYTRSRRLPVSPMRGVDDSPYQWCGESTALRIYGEFFKKYSEEVGVVCIFFLSFFLLIGAKLIFFLSNIDSPYQRYAESTTPRITDAGSWRLSVSVMRGVDGSHRSECCAVVIKKILIVYFCVCVGLLFTLFHFWGTLPCGSHLLYRETQSVGNQIQICSFFSDTS